MKSHLITTGKATILVVDLPEGAFDVGIDNSILYYRHGMMSNSAIDLVDMYGKWQPLGFLNEIKEDEAEGLVDWEDEVQFYVNYLVKGVDNIGFGGDITATESLRSLIASEVSLENPLGEKPHIFKDSENSWGPEEYKAWREAEELVYKNPFLIVEFKK